MRNSPVPFPIDDVFAEFRGGETWEPETTADKDKKSQLKNELQNIISQGRNWAGATGKNPNLSKVLTNIPDLEDLAYSRTATLNQWIRSLPSNNPITKLLDKKESIPIGIKKNIMFFVWDESKVFQKYLEQKTQNPRLKLKTFLQSEQQKRWKSESVLACYCSSNTRKGSRSKTDITYRIYNPQIRKNALTWRKNLVGFVDLTPQKQGEVIKKVKECKCKTCNVSFTRDHVNICPNIIQDPSINQNLWQKFKQRADTLKQEFPNAKNYTIMDHLINTFDIKLFDKIYKKTLENLEYTFINPTAPANDVARRSSTSRAASRIFGGST
jgi:REP element-mobilizing transposase RayT